MITRLTIATAMMATMFATPAAAQPYDCADPQTSCGAELSVVCVQRNGAGVLQATPQASRLAACQTQMARYRACLAWIAENCQAASQPAGGSQPADGGGTVVNNQTTIQGDVIQGDVVQGDKIENLQIITPGATPQNPNRTVRQHCFVFDNKTMCEPY